MYWASAGVDESWSRGRGIRNRLVLVDAHVLALGDAAVAVAGEEHEAANDGGDGDGADDCEKYEHGETFRHEEKWNARAVAWFLSLQYTPLDRAEQASFSA